MPPIAIPICKTCGKDLIEKATKRTPEQLKKSYYYTAYYWCTHCHKLYHDERFKVVNTSLFAQEPLSKNDKLSANNHKRIFQEGNAVTLTATRSSPQSRNSYDVEIWTDGACVYNGTPRARAAWAFVSGETERSGLIEGKQTNNVAEAMAIYQACIWSAQKGYKRIKLHTDSQISLYNMKKHPEQIKHNTEIFAEIFAIITKAQLQIDFVKVLGHSGEPNNERADVLANKLATADITQ